MMKYKTWMGIFLISTVIALPFVTSAKQQRRQANGVLLDEPVEEKREEQVRVAECGYSRPIRVATTSNNRPFGWAEWIKGVGGNFLVSKGFGLDVFETLAKKLKLRYQVFGYTTDQEAINELKKGNLDLLIGIYTPSSTVGRGSATIFPAVFSNVFAVYYTKDRAFEVQNYASLNNKKGMIRRTENIYPLFSQHITDDMDISLETTESAFKKLLSGEADYLIGSPYSIEAELRRYKLHDQIISSDKGMFDATMFMVLTRATDCFKLRDILGQALEEYNSDPTRADRQIRKVIDDWGERFRNDPKLTVDNESSTDTEEIHPKEEAEAED